MLRIEGEDGRYAEVCRQAGPDRPIFICAETGHAGGVNLTEHQALAFADAIRETVAPQAALPTDEEIAGWSVSQQWAFVEASSNSSGVPGAASSESNGSGHWWFGTNAGVELFTTCIAATLGLRDRLAEARAEEAVPREFCSTTIEVQPGAIHGADVYVDGEHLGKAVSMRIDMPAPAAPEPEARAEEDNEEDQDFLPDGWLTEHTCAKIAREKAEAEQWSERVGAMEAGDVCTVALALGYRWGAQCGMGWSAILGRWKATRGHAEGPTGALKLALKEAAELRGRYDANTDRVWLGDGQMPPVKNETSQENTGELFGPRPPEVGRFS